jgi:hypothetical protein
MKLTTVIRRLKLSTCRPKNLEEGRLHEFLATATNLRMLKLLLPQWDIADGDTVEVSYLRLENALKDITYPNL